MEYWDLYDYKGNKKDKILKKQCQVRIDIYFPTDYNYGE